MDLVALDGGATECGDGPGHHVGERARSVTSVERGTCGHLAESRSGAAQPSLSLQSEMSERRTA